MFGLELRDVGADRRVIPAALEKSAYPRPRMAEQRLVDEIDRRRGAFDVQEDSAYVVQLDRAPRGM
jgi:hypothetical protein